MEPETQGRAEVVWMAGPAGRAAMADVLMRGALGRTGMRILAYFLSGFLLFLTVLFIKLMTTQNR